MGIYPRASSIILMYNSKQTDRQVIFTIGHSNHGLVNFISLLKDNHIEIAVDIRSKPYSRFASQFNKTAINDSLHAHGIRYLFLGDKLGGKPDDKRFYEPEGHVSYLLISESPEFHEGIERLIKGSREYRLALMCSEESPLNCHRFHLVSRFLEKRGVNVSHIRGDGRHQSNNELASEIEMDNQKEKQLNLFPKETIKVD
jgi:uncharacterized protein (DUF488 family)